MSGPGLGLINGANALFFAINRSATAASFRPRIGCVPQPGPAATAMRQDDAARVRTRDVALEPSRTVVHRHRCKRGEKLVRGLASVQFHRERAPSARELHDVESTHPTAGGGSPRGSARARRWAIASA